MVAIGNYIHATLMQREAGMRQNSMRTKGTAFVAALAMGAFAAWSNRAEPTENEFRQMADTDTMQHGYLNLHSPADLFPRGR